MELLATKDPSDIEVCKDLEDSWWSGLGVINRTSVYRTINNYTGT